MTKIGTVREKNDVKSWTARRTVLKDSQRQNRIQNTLGVRNWQF